MFLIEMFDVWFGEVEVFVLGLLMNLVMVFNFWFDLVVKILLFVFMGGVLCVFGNILFYVEFNFWFDLEVV